MKLSTAPSAGAFVLVLASAACNGGGHATPPGPPVVSKALWIANGTNVVEYVSSQLSGTASIAPHITLNSGSFGTPQGVAFDAGGDLWVVDGGTVAAGGAVKPALYKFTAAQLASAASSTNVAPTTTITAAGFTFPQQAVFDSAGNLWVSDNGANAVYAFSTAELTGGGSIVPAVTLTSTFAFTGPLGIAFDGAGDLFVANNGGTTIESFRASQLPPISTGTRLNVDLTPSVLLHDDGRQSIQAPWAIVFDTNGNLWSSNANPPNTIVEFAKTSLTTSGSPVPAVTLSPTAVGANLTLSAPNGLAFDDLGDLAAISSATPFGVALFSGAQLGASGAPVPATFVVGTTTTLSAPAGDTFGPTTN